MKFTATQWKTSEQKERFAQQFKKFVLNNFQAKDFPKWFYTRLSMTFGNIAHYNQNGFFDYWFSNTDRKQSFIQSCLTYPCYGCPTFTYSDVEKYLQNWIKEESGLYQITLF